MNAPAPEQLGYVKALDGSPLYVVFHPAAAELAPRVPAVIAPALFEERKSAYAVLRRLAARLAAAGHPVLRFDYRGSGESGGVPTARRWQHLLDDLTVARQTLAELSGKADCLLLGLRLGATLILQEAARGRCFGAIALAPVVKGATQVRLWKMRSKIRAELTQESVAPRGTAFQAVNHGQDARATGPHAADIIDFDGYEVSPAFFDDVSAIDLLKTPPLSCPTRLVQISHRSDTAPETTQLLAALGARAQLNVLRLEPFWDKLDDVDTRSLEELVLAAAKFGSS